MSKAIPISMLEFGERIDLCLCCERGGGGGGERGRVVMGGGGGRGEGGKSGQVVDMWG